jgi:Zn-dependent M16 (insulinase) family peptidase
MMEALRQLSLEEIQAYHSKYYAPHNLCLIITGRMSTSSLLQQVQKTIESRAILHGQDKGPKPEGWKRPFVETDSAIVPRLDKKTEIQVQFPAKEEKYGEVRIVMVGPKPDDEVTQFVSSHVPNGNNNFFVLTIGVGSILT